MYHRFHAPHDGTVEQVTYISGDTWNVNPIALQRVEQPVLQERARGDPHAAGRSGHLVTLVPVAAILVASIRLHFLDVAMNMNYRGAAEIDCDATVAKGDELGWFEHGSTIIVFAPPGFRLCDGHQPRHRHPHGPRAHAPALKGPRPDRRAARRRPVPARRPDRRRAERRTG